MFSASFHDGIRAYYCSGDRWCSSPGVERAYSTFSYSLIGLVQRCRALVRIDHDSPVCPFFFLSLLMNLARLNAAGQTCAHTNEPLAGPSTIHVWCAPTTHRPVHRWSPPGQGFGVLRRHDWQMNWKPLIKLGAKLTWLHLGGFSRPLWTECLIVAEVFYPQLS